MATYQINNFGGTLTRKRFGSMNSGLTPVGKGHSMDPFDDPPSLVFTEAAANLDPTHATVLDMMVDGVPVEESGNLYIYCVDRSGTVYKIDTATDAITIVTNSLGVTLHYGGGIRYILPGSNNKKLFITHDTGALYMNTDGTGVANIRNFVSFDVATTGVSTSNDTIEIPSDLEAPIYVGQAILFQGETGTAPSPLIVGTTYYVIPFDATHIRLATSYANAIAGTQINITTVGTTGPFTFQVDAWIPNIPHPVSDEFFGGLFIGNGPYLVDFAIGALIVSHASRLDPTFPVNYIISAVEVDGQGRYLRAVATTGTFNDIIAQDGTAPTQAPISRSLYWNGVDTSYDSYDPFQQSYTTSSASFLGVDVSWAQDFWGAGLFQGNGGAVDKISAAREVKNPNSGSITSTGTLLFYAAPYYVQQQWRAGIFAFGRLDDSDQNATYPVLAIPPSGTNTVCTAVGMLKLARNRYLSEAGTLLSQSKFYVSTYETGGTAKANLYSFNLTPNGGTPNDGVYETQVELFPVMQQIDSVSFYMLPTQSGVHFRLELVDADGTVSADPDESFEYEWAAGTDETELQGSLETFDWSSPEVKNFQGMGIRITNLGTVQPRITNLLIQSHDVDRIAKPETPIPAYG